MFLNESLYGDDALKDPASLSKLALFRDPVYADDSDNMRHLRANPSIAVRQKDAFTAPLSREQIRDEQEHGRNYEEFLKKYEALSPDQQERAAALINRIVFSALQFQEWGSIHHAKMMDRHAWHYYIDNGSFPEEYPMPHFAWMDSDDVKRMDNRNDAQAKAVRYKHVLEHLKRPIAEGMVLPSRKMASPVEAHLIPWQFDERQLSSQLGSSTPELPFPHELGLSDVTREHSEKVYTLRHKMRRAISEIDDQDVVNAVFAHPDVRDNVTMLQFYAGLCEGEQERYFEHRAHNEIGKVLERGPGQYSEADMEKLGRPAAEGGILPFHPRSFAEVSHTLNHNLTPQQRSRYLGIEGDAQVDLEATARQRLGELLTDGHYSTPLSKVDKLAVLIGLLGEYGYSENYTLLAANEINFIEQASIRRDMDGNKINDGITYGPDTVVAFPGAGSLPLSAIFKHVMTDAPMILIDIDPDAIKRAGDFIGMLERFGVVTPGKMVCAQPSSAEVYFDGAPSKAEPMTEGYFAGKLGKDGRMLSSDQYDKPLVSVVELASLLPDRVKYKTVDAVSRLPQMLKPDAVMCRTTFGKASSIYDKVPRLPMCLSYDYRASSTPRTITASGDAKEERGPLRYYSDNPITQVSAAHLYMRPGFGIKNPLPIVKNAASSIPAHKILTQETEIDPAFGVLRRPEINLLKRNSMRLYQDLGFSIGSDGAEPSQPQAEPEWSTRRMVPPQGEPSWIQRRNDVPSGTHLSPGS